MIFKKAECLFFHQVEHVLSLRTYQWWDHNYGPIRLSVQKLNLEVSFHTHYEMHLQFSEVATFAFRKITVVGEGHSGSKTAVTAVGQRRTGRPMRILHK